MNNTLQGVDLAVTTLDFTEGGIFRVTQRLQLAASVVPDSLPIRLTAFHPEDYTAPYAEIRKTGRLVWDAGKLQLAK